MAKILLVGELGSIVRNINECLMEEFSVNINSVDINMIKKMEREAKPDLVIFCHIELRPSDRDFLYWLDDETRQTPVLVLSTMEHYREIRNYCQFKDIYVMFRPVAKGKLIDKCKEIIKKSGQ